jgi:hypothetical protein
MRPDEVMLETRSGPATLESCARHGATVRHGGKHGKAKWDGRGSVTIPNRTVGVGLSKAIAGQIARIIGSVVVVFIIAVVLVIAI